MALPPGSGLVLRGIPASSPGSSGGFSGEASAFNPTWLGSATGGAEELCSLPCSGTCSWRESTGTSSGAEFEDPREAKAVEEVLSSAEDKFVVLCMPGRANNAPEIKHPGQFEDAHTLGGPANHITLSGRLGCHGTNVPGAQSAYVKI